MERKRYSVGVGSALLGQPAVRLILADGRTHNFFRRKKQGETWTSVEPEVWVVDLDPKEANRLLEDEYSVSEINTGHAPRKRRGTKEEE